MEIQREQARKRHSQFFSLNLPILIVESDLAKDFFQENLIEYEECRLF